MTKTKPPLCQYFALIHMLMALCLGLVAAQTASAAAANGGAGFGFARDANYFTVDTGAGLVFKVRRQNSDGSMKRLGDIASMTYKGVQYQDALTGSHINSGFHYLYKGTDKVAVDAALVDADHVRITVKAGNLTHYYLAQRGDAKIYMGTYFSSQPDTLGLVRFIVRVPIAVLPNGPKPSDLRGNKGAIESQDIFGMPNGETRSKHYSNMRLKDWSYIGATGNKVGVWVVRDNNEGNSGGPFYRSLLNQSTDRDQELTYIVNYGQAQTEPYRVGVLNAYTLVFTDGGRPETADTSWFSGMGLSGFVPAAKRGTVVGVGIRGRDPAYKYTVGFSNSTAQYWADAASSDGHFYSAGMRPGTYEMKVYKNELAVVRGTVVVEAGKKAALHSLSITDDPSAASAVWRIGDWDGTPAELLNGDKVTTMHPSDKRMRSWKTPDYVVGKSAPATGFPAYQWKDVNGAITVRFTLRQEQIAAMTLRVGITTAFSGARPAIKINAWSARTPAISAQPSTRNLTVGSYRGNNTMFSFAVPAKAFVVGENVLTLGAASGTTGAGYLSPGVAYDAVDLLAAPQASSIAKNALSFQAAPAVSPAPPTAPSSVETQWGTLNEPTLPSAAAVCRTLAAGLTPLNGSLDALDGDPAKSQPDTGRIQTAIDDCPSGQAVKLAMGEAGRAAFLSGPLKLKSGVTLWIDRGVTLFASRNPADFDNGLGACGTATTARSKSCNPFILADGATGSGIVGDGTIDGRGGSLLTSGPNANRRSWWDLAWQNGGDGLYQQSPRLIQINNGSDFTLYRIAVLNSPNIHIVADGMTGVTAWGIKILSPSLAYTRSGYACPANSTPDKTTQATCFTPDTVKNTDGFNLALSSKVLLAHSYISVGADHVGVKSSNGKQPSRHLAFLSNHFYYGQGLSIGSETDAGVSDMVVTDLAIDGNDSPGGNGLRIKSDASSGGDVHDVTYSRICMRNVRRPLVFDSSHASVGGSKYPNFSNITVSDFHFLGSAKYGGGELTFAGYDLNGQKHPLAIILDNVVFDGAQPRFAAGHNGGPSILPAATHFVLGPGAVSFASSIEASAANDVTVDGAPGSWPPFDCGSAFVPLGSVLPSSPI